MRKNLDTSVFLGYNIYCQIYVWVWRSLVACLNGVQEAGGSNPLTQTKKPLGNLAKR